MFNDIWINEGSRLISSDQKESFEFAPKGLKSDYVKKDSCLQNVSIC